MGSLMRLFWSKLAVTRDFGNHGAYLRQLAHSIGILITSIGSQHVFTNVDANLVQRLPICLPSTTPLSLATPSAASSPVRRTGLYVQTLLLPLGIVDVHYSQGEQCLEIVLGRLTDIVYADL